MPRAFSATLEQALYAPQTAEALLDLLIVEHDNLASPLRVVNNGEDVVSNSKTFTATRFTLSLPSERDAAPQARLAISNIDRSVVEVIRSLASSPTIRIQLVLASDPDTVELDVEGLELSNVTYDAGTVEATLSFRDVLSEPYPGDMFAPYGFEGIFNTVNP